MKFTGSMRIYFNRHGAFPLMWCIEPDPREIDRSDVEEIRAWIAEGAS